MIKVVSNEEMRQLDNYTINNLKVPGIILMENAGYQSFLKIKSACEQKNIHKVLVLTGKGNNGGDGFVVARHLSKAGFEVRIYALAVEDELSGDAKVNFTICKNYKIPIFEIRSVKNLPEFVNDTLIVDAVFGIGIKGAVRGLPDEVIQWVNQQNALVAAIDIPSGLNGNSAMLSGSVIKADLTVTMALPKYAQLFYPAKERVGELFIADIGMPRFVEQSNDITINLVEDRDVRIKPLEAWSHKYSAGKVFILAGSPGMTGAAVLSALGAGVSGAGLIYVGIPQSLNPILETKLTEQLTLPLADYGNEILSDESLSDINRQIEWADAFLIGPGMGRDPQTLKIMEQALLHALSMHKKIVVDADALFMLSENSKIQNELTENVVLTPHYGEFLRLSGEKKEVLQETPWKSVQSFMKNHSCVMNLKGAPSMTGGKGQIYINSTGNRGLAKGGSGDILSGLIAGFTARGIEPVKAAYYANFYHGKSADMALKEFGSHSYQPQDILSFLKKLV